MAQRLILIYAADDVVLNNGTGGATAAADDIGGVMYQRVKPSIGADGSASDAIPVSNGLDTTAAGVQAVGIVGQFDDAATGTVTENQFAPIRISSRRAVLVEGVASGTAVAVSATSLPLPSGASTSAKQDTIIGHLDGVEGLLTTAATAAKQDEQTTHLNALTNCILPGDALGVNGFSAHDEAIVANHRPLTTGGYASAAAPTSVSADGDAVHGWFLRNGAQATVLTAAGALIGGDATNGLDVDVTRVGGTVAVTQSGPWDEVGIHDSGNSITVDGTVAVTGVSTLAEQQTQTTALQLIDDAIFTDDTSTHATGTTKGVGIMAVATATDAAVNANDIGMVGMTTDRKLHVAVMDALPAGTAAIGKLAANSGVDIGDVTLTANDGVDIGNVDVASVVPGTGATNLGKAEDGGHTTGDVGVFNLGVRVDTPNVALTNADADYSALTTNKLGSLRTAALEDDLATAATKHTYKYYTNSGAVTDGIVWSPAAGTRWFLTSLTINTSAAATVTIEDDVAAGDVVRFKFEFAANSGIHMSFPVPMFSGEDAADLLVTTSAGNIYITAVGYEI